MLNIRLRAGVAGEATRVVHAASGMTDGTLVSLCGQVFDPALVEEARGMPCMHCVRVTIQLNVGLENTRRELERRPEQTPRR